MLRTIRHAAPVLGAACLVPLLTGCHAPGERAAHAVSVSFVADPGDPDLGAVLASPVAEEVGRAIANGLPDEALRSFLSLHVGDTTAAPMLGTWDVVGDTLRFRPRFPPADGVTYAARWNPAALAGQAPAGAAVTMWTYALPARPSTTVVSAIHPTADSLPMNLLRMYVQFSAPMTTGRSYDHIRLYAAGDSLLEEPFFTGGNAIELWDPDKTRLTILFDPGRIKRDLRPHEQRGLPLQQGLHYRLVIDSAWRDAGGQALAAGYVKEFTVGPVDRGLVRVRDWTLAPPASGTREALTVAFPEPLDHALLSRLLVVRDASGRVVPGQVTVDHAEQRWSFMPASAWRATVHRLEVDTELEDLAGNNLRRLFDVAPGDTAARGVDVPRVHLSFTPR
jgi:hypothetical protein